MARYGYIKFKDYYVPINESRDQWVGNTLPEYVKIPKSELLSPIDFNSVSWASRTGVNDYYALTSFRYLYDAFTEMSWFELTEDNTDIPANHMLFQVTPGDYRLMSYIYRSGSAYRYYCYSSVINGPNGAATSDDIILADYLYIWFKLTSYANGSLSFCVSTVPPATPTGYLSGTVQYLRSNLSYDTVEYSTYESIFNVYTERPKNAVNFYIFSPDPNIKLNRGDSVEYRYIIVYDDGTSEFYTDIIYSDLSFKNGGKIANIENNILTIAETCTASFVSFTAKPNIENTKLFANAIIEIANPLGIYDEGGTSGPSGGGGTFGKDEVSDSIFGDLPPGSVDAQDSATGMYTRYLMNSSYLDLLGDWVWDPNLGLSLIQTAIKPFFNDPEQALISLISFPFQLSAPLVGISTRSQHCYFGHQPTGATFVALTTQSAQINWGTIDLQEYWGNFLDYAPHTKIELYLPWGTGFVNLDPGQCLPGTLTVITNIELQRGSCVHNVVNSAGCVIGSYAGQCGKQIPLIASDIAAKRAGLVTATAGALVAGAAIAAAPSVGVAGFTASTIENVSGKIVGGKLWTESVSTYGMQGYTESVNAVKKGEKLAANIASKSSVASLKTPVSVQRNGGFTDGSAGMGIQYPYIILSRPEQNVPENYGHHFGYPSNVYVRLSSLRGYTEIGSIHLDSIPATNAELEELDGILKGGVIF